MLIKNDPDLSHNSGQSDHYRGQFEIAARVREEAEAVTEQVRKVKEIVALETRREINIRRKGMGSTMGTAEIAEDMEECTMSGQAWDSNIEVCFFVSLFVFFCFFVFEFL